MKIIPTDVLVYYSMEVQSRKDSILLTSEQNSVQRYTLALATLTECDVPAGQDKQPGRWTDKWTDTSNVRNVKTNKQTNALSMVQIL